MEFKSVNKIFENSFRTNWDRPAISNYQGVTLKFGDVARRMEKLHIMFEECGLQRGDKVALCSRNQANWAVAFLATMTYGAVPVPLLHEFKSANIHHLVNHSEAKILFADDVISSHFGASYAKSGKRMLFCEFCRELVDCRCHCVVFSCSHNRLLSAQSRAVKICLAQT